MRRRADNLVAATVKESFRLEFGTTDDAIVKIQMGMAEEVF